MPQDDLTPRTQADLVRVQARDAMARGEAAVAAGDLAGASAWFERARRMVPADPAVLLALGAVKLRLGDPEAASLFADAGRLADTREIWLGLAAASLAVGDVAAARAALARMLMGHVLPADTATVSHLAGLAGVGWCGVGRGEDGLRWVCDAAGAQVRADGVRLTGPAIPADARVLAVTVRGATLLGGTIDLTRLRGVEGFVGEAAGGLEGWAWLPADADADPWITVSDGVRSLRVQATGGDIAPLRPMTRPRQFRVAQAELAGFGAPLHVTGEDGRPLTGSPADPQAPVRAAMAMARLASAECPAVGPAALEAEPIAFSAPADLAGPTASAPLAPERPVAIVIPVYRGRALTAACLRSVFASLGDARVIVVNDATPEPALAADLDRLAAAGRITLIRHADNLGFPRAANAGLRAAFALEPPHDALLLNSDTLVPVGPGATWLYRLRRAVHASPDIGTASPLSNDATILSYPDRDGANPPPSGAALARQDAAAARHNGLETVDVPTTVGFCLYLRRECAVQVGLFRPSLFAQGYGEENDLCLRARHLGWRNVAVTGVFVAHLGGASFGAARAPLVARNLAVMERVHPGYHALIARYQGRVAAEDALAPARRRLDLARWAAARGERASILLVTHDAGGGVERVVRQRAADIAAAGMRPIVLRPVHDPDTAGGFMAGLCRVEEGCEDATPGYPNLVFRLPQELGELARLLRADRPALLELHHRLGHHPSVMDLVQRLRLPLEICLHDHASFCPRVTLLGPEHRYCGEPMEVATCEACVADAGSRLGETIGVAALRARSAAEFAAARRVVVPSADMGTRMRRHFPQLRAEVLAHENDAAVADPPPPSDASPFVICVIGGLAVDKGFEVLLACARDAAARRLPLSFRLVGHSHDDARLIDTGRVFVTGRYGAAEAEALVRAQGAHLAFLPSIIPETWGFTLSLAWRAGLHAAVFDIGALGARVRATGRGLLLPLGLPAGAINQALMTSRPLATAIASLAAPPSDRLSTVLPAPP